MAAMKLVVVSGPNRGATYFLDDGENILGRAAENQIVLASTQVSKKHCAIVYSNRKAEIRDLGSSNGTFVNGVLVKKKLLQNRDRVSLGPFVLEALIPEIGAKASAQGTVDMGAPISIDPGQFKMEDEQPKGLVGKYKKKFDDVFLPVLYDFYEKTEYVNLLVAMFAVFVILNLGFTVYPVLQRSREEVLRQAEHQAKYISEQVAFLNRQAIMEAKEGSLFTEFAEAEVNVKEVVIANLDGRIMAPGARLNETYQNTLFLGYKDRLQRTNTWWGKTRVVRLVDKEEIVSFTPVMVMSKTKGINVPAAVAVVIYSTSSIALDSGTIGTVYLEALFWSGLLGIVFLYLLVHVTHRPIHKLVDDMDGALKGDRDSVEKKYQNEVIDQLIDTVNSALGRIPKSNKEAQQEAAEGDSAERVIIENMMRGIEYVSMKANRPLMLLDTEMRIKMTNSNFDELTGIRDATGEVLETVSRDESFPALIREMMANAAGAGNTGVSEDYDFSSGAYKVHGIAISGMPGQAEAYLFMFEKQGD